LTQRVWALARARAIVGSFIRRHPDRAALLLILIAALAPRLAFAFRAPVFLISDSIAYFQSGYDLARGAGFDLPYKRAPLYPLFIAGGVWLSGPDLQAIGFLQHALGALSAALTFRIGRLLFGRLAGLAAGLLVALSGPLIIYEHYLVAEPLFIVLLLGFTLSVVRGVRAPDGSWRWFVLSGLLLGMAGLTRSVGVAILPAVPPALLLALRWPRAVVSSLAVLAGFLVVIAPWMARNYVEFGAFEIAGGSGQHLVERISRHDEGFTIPSSDSPSPYADPVRTEARALILRQMDREARPSAINHRLMETYGWGDVQANQAMRDVGLEIILAQPERYLVGTLAKTRRLLGGTPETIFGYHWASRRNEELRRSWESNPSIAYLLTPPSPFQEAEKTNADRIISFFSPYALRGPLAFLLLAGLLTGLRPATRWATVLLVLLVVALIVPSTALVGYVPRYRYPADPFLAVLVGAGLAGLLQLAPRSVRFVGRRSADSDLSPLGEERSRAVREPAR
jgi:4-amino-4-deoxy-L-arabinose transferase-like glycosyltransferase